MDTTSRRRTRREGGRPAPKPVNVLLVEDSEDDAQLLLYELRRQGFDPAGTRVDTGPALCDALEAGSWDVIISDHNMPSFTGDDALRLAREHAPDVPFIVVSGTRGEDHAVQVMRAGASDFIVKSRLHRLAPVIERELEETRLRREQRATEEALEASQQQLREAQRLESVGRLAGGVAHDFNNLMASILTYADIALKSLPSEDALRPDIEEIKRAGARAAQLTRELLSFSRQQNPDRAVLDLTEIIDGMRGLLAEAVGPAVRLEVCHDPCLWNVKADRTQVEQMLLNLAGNARDAMPDGGTMTVRTANADLSVPDAAPRPPQPGQYVRLDVHDTGAGIQSDLHDKLFEPFFTTKGEGTGLGLAMVYGLVQQLDGFVLFDSQPESGTTFSLYLPRTTENTHTL